MGHTHYWNVYSSIPLEIWNQILDDAKKLIEASPCSITFETDDNRPPELSEDMIRFNGHHEDTGHETFLFVRHPEKFAFCKTERKKYDKVVVGILALIKEKAPHYVNISSDGDKKEWATALRWANKVLGRKLPNPIEQEDDE